MTRDFHIIAPTGHISGGYRELSDAEYDLSVNLVDEPRWGEMLIIEADSIEAAEALIPSYYPNGVLA